MEGKDPGERSIRYACLKVWSHSRKSWSISYLVDVFKRNKVNNFIEPLSNEPTVTNHDILLPLSFQQ